MTFWTWLGLLTLITWFWLCPLVILAGIAAALGLRSKGKEKREAWEKTHESKARPGT